MSAEMRAETEVRRVCGGKFLEFQRSKGWSIFDFAMDRLNSV